MTQFSESTLLKPFLSSILMLTLRIYHTVKAYSFLAWPAWLRVLVVLPVLVFLWLAAAWACAEVNA
jgi:hypothetical protein